MGEPLQIRRGAYPEKPSDGNTTIRDHDLVAFTGSRQPAAQVCSELRNRDIHFVSVQMITSETYKWKPIVAPPTAAKFMAALAVDPNQRRRLMVELLARTGMRAGELASLEAGAMVASGSTHWLRIPVGKLHNDRYIPLLPELVELIDTWNSTRPPPQSGRLVERDDGQPFDRRTIARYVAAVAKRAGVGHVHPHQLRHTLATQAINRGMSLEAIAALLGHRSMRMTLTYARISDRTVADEYFRVTQAVEASYANAEPIAADATGPNMRRLAADHRRLLGNGHCTRPTALDCQFETICERCGFFDTGPQFVTILNRQRDHAARNDQPDRAALFTDLLGGIDAES